MNYILAAAIVILVVASECIFFAKAHKKTAQDQRVIEALLKVIVDKLDEKKEQPKSEASPDDKASNAERLYLEGIQSVLTYDIDTVRKYFRGDDEN